jgi:hypothetical protein|nr:MAG TPA: hypothetical protein [Caudoviricetes sp.]
MLDVSNIQAIILVKIAELSLFIGILTQIKYNMLKSKRDESIKRYLSRVGKLEHKSKLYNSMYYRISYGEGLEILIRFSDHFNSDAKSKNVSIDIVKSSVGFYILKTSYGVSATLGEKTVIPYLKSLLTVYPEVLNSVASFMNAAQKAERQMVNVTGEIAKLKSEFDKKSKYIDLVDTVYDENKKLVSDNKVLQNTVNLQKDQYSELKTKYTNLVKKYDQLKKLEDAIRNVLG